MRRTFFISGHARLPKTVTAQHVYETVGLTLEIEPRYLVIVDASATFITQHARSFVRSLLVGHSLQDGIEPLMRDIERYYHSGSQRALLAALTDIWDQLPQALEALGRPAPAPAGGKGGAGGSGAAGGTAGG